MITFEQLIAACFHPITAEEERLDAAVFEGTEGGRIPGFESAAGVHIYRHDALNRMATYYATPLYLLHNPERNSCLMATTPVPYRDKHFLTEVAEVYTAQEAFEKVVQFFSGSQKEVIPSELY